MVGCSVEEVRLTPVLPSLSIMQATGRTSRRPRTDEGEEGGEDAAEEADAAGEPAQANGESKSAKRRKQKKAAAAAKAAGATNADGTPAAAAEKPARAQRQPKGEPKGEPSKTLLFVANLPFEVTDEKLREAFADFKVTSAHVVKRKFGKRSKGFGFVDFADESEQQRALTDAQGKSVEGRELQLKVAIQGDKDAQKGSVAAGVDDAGEVVEASAGAAKEPEPEVA